jgi:hypothetical protein
MTPRDHQLRAPWRRGVGCPALDDLALGGVIGSVLVTGIVTRHRSPWFRGPYALVFADPRPEPFRPARGQVGLFRVLVAMIKIAITQAAFDAIASTLPLGSVAYENETTRFRRLDGPHIGKGTPCRCR